MRKGLFITAIAFAMAFGACTKDYKKDIVGSWDAGKGSLEKNMTVVIKADGTVTAEVKDMNMIPLKGTYRIDNDKVYFKFPKVLLAWRIVKLNNDVLVIKTNDARLTWHRIK